MICKLLDLSDMFEHIVDVKWLDNRNKQWDLYKELKCRMLEEDEISVVKEYFFSGDIESFLLHKPLSIIDEVLLLCPAETLEEIKETIRFYYDYLNSHKTTVYKNWFLNTDDEKLNINFTLSLLSLCLGPAKYHNGKLLSDVFTWAFGTIYDESKVVHIDGDLNTRDLKFTPDDVFIPLLHDYKRYLTHGNSMDEDVHTIKLLPYFTSILSFASSDYFQLNLEKNKRKRNSNGKKILVNQLTVRESFLFFINDTEKHTDIAFSEELRKIIDKEICHHIYCFRRHNTMMDTEK